MSCIASAKNRDLQFINNSRGNILREPFPYEDRNQDNPEKAHPLLLQECSLPAVQGIEELYGRDELRVDGKSWVDQEYAHDTCMSTS